MRVSTEEQLGKRRAKAMTLRVEAADEKERLALDAAARAKEKLEKECKAEEEGQTCKMTDRWRSSAKLSMKVVKTKKDEDGKKIETTVDGLAKKTRQELIKEQRELMIDERVSFEEERVLLRLAWEKQQKEEEAEHLKTVELLRVQAGRAHDLAAEKARLSQMTPAVEAFKARVMTQRNVLVTRGCSPHGAGGAQGGGAPREGEGRPAPQSRASGPAACRGGVPRARAARNAASIELLVDLLKHRPDLYPERMKTAVDRLSSHLWNVVRHDNGVSNGLAKARDLNERVQAQASLALARLALGNAANQSAVTACGGVALLISCRAAHASSHAMRPPACSGALQSTTPRTRQPSRRQVASRPLSTT